MASISMFWGIIIRMYFNEHNPLHLHAAYGEFEGTFNITTSEFRIYQR